MQLEGFSRKQCWVAGSSSLLNWLLPLLDLCPLVGHTHILLTRDMPSVHNQFQGNARLTGYFDNLALNNRKEPTKDGYCFEEWFCVRSRHWYQSKFSRSKYQGFARRCNHNAPIQPMSAIYFGSFPQLCNQEHTTK